MAAPYVVLQELVKTNRSLLKQLEDQLAYFQRKRDARYAEFFETSGQNQQFFYRSDENGLIQTDNDAAFVAEQVFSLISGPSEPLPYGVRFTLTDVSSGRTLSMAPRRVPNDSAQDIPLGVLSPSDHFSDTGQNQNDYWFYLTSEYLVPRGAVLRFQDSNLRFLTTDALSNFVVAGYKKY